MIDTQDTPRFTIKDADNGGYNVMDGDRFVGWGEDLAEAQWVVAAKEAEAKRAEMVARLRAAVEWLDANPAADASQINLTGDTIVISNYGVDTADEIAAIARELGGKWDKRVGADLFHLTREVTDGVVYELVAWRSQVCERVVVATREVEVEEPDPDAVAALPKVKRTETVEEVEWRCEPLLAGRTEA